MLQFNKTKCRLCETPFRISTGSSQEPTGFTALYTSLNTRKSRTAFKILLFGRIVKGTFLTLIQIFSFTFEFSPFSLVFCIIKMLEQRTVILSLVAVLLVHLSIFWALLNYYVIYNKAFLNNFNPVFLFVS